MDSLELLRKRRAKARPEDMVAGMVFNGVLELARREVGDDLRRELHAISGLPNRTIPFLKYPVAGFLDMSAVLIERLVERGEPLMRAFERIGFAGTEAFFASAVGQTMMAMNGGNLHRMGSVASTAYASVYSYGTRRYERTGERSAVLHFTGDFMGPWVQSGVVKVGLGKMNKVQLAVGIVGLADEGRTFTFELSW